MLTEFILSKLESIVPFPDYVSKNLDDYNMVKTSAYAYPAHQDYPCNTASNTFLSAARYYYNTIVKKAQANSLVERKLEEYADFWNIRPDIQIIKESMKKAAMPKKAKYIIPELKKYPITDENQRKKSAEDFINERNQLPFDIRYKVANELSDIKHPAILKSACQGIYNAKTISNAIARRAYLVKSKDFKLSEGLNKLAKVIENQEDITKDEFIKIAKVMDWFDTEYGYPYLFEDEAVKYTEHDINEIKNNLVKVGEYVYLRSDLEKNKDILISIVPLYKKASIFEINEISIDTVVNEINKDNELISLAQKILLDKNVKPIEL